MKKLLMLCIVGSTLFGASIYDVKNDLCYKNKYDIAIGSKVSFFDILERLSQECLLSVIFEDEDAQKSLKTKHIILNFHKKSLNYILDAGFRALDLSYSFDGNTIRVSRLQTQTFSIHHISTMRQAQSSTNIVFSQDVNDKSILNDDSNNKSGSKIESQDTLDFWGELKNKLYFITFRELDSFTPNKEHDPIIIDKNSGLITITALKSQIARAKKYIDELNLRLSKQVLIDVSILTLTHSNSNTTGINWESLSNVLANTSTSKDNKPLLSINNGSVNFGLNLFTNNLTLSRLVGFLKRYGKVRTLSNPKILTLNNQPALISVGNIIRYSQNQVFQTANNQHALQNTREIFPSVFSGVLLDITPTIQGKSIMLRINPSITSAKDARDENQTDALTRPPNLSTNQLSSIIKLNSNQKVVLGGLISKTNTKQISKVPFLGSIPFLGYFFSYEENILETREMVIVISARIVN